MAEVLITLGIIGVVAALTIPTLMQKTNDSEIVSQLTKDFTVLNQAWKMVELEYGTIDKWDLKNTDTGIDAEDGTRILDNSAQKIVSSRLREHLNVSKVFEQDESYGNMRYYLNGNQLGTTPFKATAGDDFQLSDGTIIRLGWYSPSEKKMDLLVLLPYGKKTIIGENTFYFSIGSKGIFPEGYQDDINNPMTWACNPAAPDSRFPGRGCTAWVIYNKNLDYKYCADDLSWNGKQKCD